MPAYAVDVELVALLVERYGFDGGGGNGKITAKALKQMLLDPHELASDVSRYADRQVANADSDAIAERLAVTSTVFSSVCAKPQSRHLTPSMPRPVQQRRHRSEREGEGFRSGCVSECPLPALRRAGGEAASQRLERRLRACGSDFILSSAAETLVAGARWSLHAQRRGDPRGE